MAALAIPRFPASRASRSRTTCHSLGKNGGFKLLHDREEGAMENTSQGTQFGDLPAEIILLIATHIPSEREINFLVRCSRFLHRTLNSYLYTRNLKCKSSRNALTWASTRNKESTARLALRQYKTLRRTKPLLLAAKYGNVAIVKLLLSMDGVDLEGRTNDNLTPLALAVVKWREEIVKLLLDAGAQLDLNANKPDNSKAVDTLLCLAVRDSPDIGALRLLLATGKLDVNKQNIHDDTPLCLALLRNNVEMVRVLLEAGADPNGIHRSYNSPLSVAVRVCDMETIKMLLAHGANPAHRHNHGQHHPLYGAIRWNRPDVLELLLEAEDVDINHQGIEGRSLLSYAINRSNPGQLPILLLSRKDLDPNLGSLNRDPIFPLYDAIMREHFEVALALMNDPRISDYSRSMGLVAAAKTPSAAQFLEPLYESIAGGLDVNHDIEEDRGTLLMRACESSNTAATKLLLEKWGADPNYAPRYGWDDLPIFIAINNNFIEGVRLLLATGKVDANQTYENGNKPLLQAAQGGSWGFDMIKVLIEEGGADPNALPHWRSPLSMMVWGSQSDPRTTEAVKYLLGVEGIDPSIPDKYGSRSLDHAREAKNQECVDLIEAKLRSMGKLTDTDKPDQPLSIRLGSQGKQDSNQDDFDNPWV